jgi:hypothetical protein
MAKRKKNASAAIREHYQHFPSDKPAAIVEALKAKGISVKSNYVSMILTKLRKAVAESGDLSVAVAPKRRGRPKGSSKKKVTAAPAKVVAKTSGGRFGFEELNLAKQLVAQMGTASAAKQLIDALA